MRATLDGWRAEVIAEVEAEIANDDSAPNSCANPVNYARNQARQQQAEEAKRGQHLAAEDELVWARERFRADCAARAIRTSEDAEWHYTRIRDARAAVVRAHCI